MHDITAPLSYGFMARGGGGPTIERGVTELGLGAAT
jgi:hypothetical protein